MLHPTVLPTYIFESSGLRFDVRHLLNMKKAIAHLPVRTQAEYVDAVTYDAVKLGILMHVPGEADFSKINTTSIGNIAFISLYHDDEPTRIRAKMLLDGLRSVVN